VEQEKVLFHSSRVKRAEGGHYSREGVEQEKGLFHSNRLKRAEDITVEKEWSKRKFYFTQAE
jgi:hypothetical protein